MGEFKRPEDFDPRPTYREAQQLASQHNAQEAKRRKAEAKSQRLEVDRRRRAALSPDARTREDGNRILVGAAIAAVVGVVLLWVGSGLSGAGFEAHYTPPGGNAVLDSYKINCDANGTPEPSYSNDFEAISACSEELDTRHSTAGLTTGGGAVALIGAAGAALIGSTKLLQARRH